MCAADAMCVDHGMSNAPSAGSCSNVIEIADWVWLFTIYGRKDRGIAEDQASGDSLNSAGCSKSMAAHGFNRRYRNAPGVRTERGLYRGCLCGIIVDHRISVRADIVDICRTEIRVMERHSHRASRSMTTRLHTPKFAAFGRCAES
jgi:hypothetical protein